MTERIGFTSLPVFEFAKPKGIIIAGEREYKNKRFFEIREWVGDGGEIPTRKGITIPPEAVPELAEALQAYAATVGSKPRDIAV